MKDKKKNKINQEITNPTIRLTGSDFIGEIVSLKIALDKSTELGLDLVLINEKEGVGICKIMKYEKFIYEQSKKPKNKGLDVKEIKLGPNTSENDMEYRVKHMIDFLKKGHRVKLSMRFKGRENKFIDDGMTLILKTLLRVEEFGTSEALPKLEGKQIIGYIKPISRK